MTVFLIIAATLAGAWGGAVCVLALFQRRFIYRPEQGAVTPAEASTPWFSIVRNGEGELLGWWSPPRHANGVVLVVFHGNRGTLARLASKTTPLHQWGFGLFLGTYRGYEGKSGWPTETGLIADGEASVKWVLGQGVSADQIVLYGESLGGAVALAVAQCQNAAALVLEAPFTRLRDMARIRHPWAPSFLLRDHFDNLRRIASLALPTLILHGEVDKTVPVDHARKLAKAAGEGCQLSIYPHAGHLDILENGGLATITGFLSHFSENRL